MSVWSITGAAECALDDPGAVTMIRVGLLLPADSPRSEGESAEHVRALAELDGPLPPIVVRRSTLQVIDGMHRLHAARARGAEKISAVLFDGTDQEAFLLAVKLNTTHGLPLSQADRKAAAARILAECPQWSDRAVASVAGVSPKTVGAIRRRSTGALPRLNDRVGQDGRVRSLDAAAGRRRAREVILAEPDASLRTIASRAGIALATARDVRERMRRGEDPLPPGTRAHRRSPQCPPVTVTDLTNDPSMRHSECGRAVLRLLNLHPPDAQDWARLAASVPSHRAEAVAEAARRCANSWQSFAESLERRGDRGNEPRKASV
ncbi:ParB/RepB/Spo0J family partition protein [Amycolatopsis lurida]